MSTYTYPTLLLALALTSLALAQKPWEPTPRSEDWWLERHEQFVRTSRENASNIEAVFLGSSSIEYWSTTAKTVWDVKYAPLHSVNYGIGGDKIENCLWRIVNGELDGINPKLLVLYCGSNNIDNPSNSEIARGISTTLDEISRRLPNTNILYVAFNPRGDREPVATVFEKISAINQEIIGLHGGRNKTVVFDMFDMFIISWGQINTLLYQNDKLHLNLGGYQLWDQLWNSTFYTGMYGNYP